MTSPPPPRREPSVPLARQRGDHDPVMPPPEFLSRFGARLLDPATAVGYDGQRIRPTVYLADHLLVASAAPPGWEPWPDTPADKREGPPAALWLLGKAANRYQLDVERGAVTDGATTFPVRIKPLAGAG